MIERMKRWPFSSGRRLTAGSMAKWRAWRDIRPVVAGPSAVVVADVVLADPANSAASDTPDRVKNDLLDACRRTLAAHKVPAMLRFVPSLEFTAAGKLVRPGG